MDLLTVDVEGDRAGNWGDEVVVGGLAGEDGVKMASLQSIQEKYISNSPLVDAFKGIV